MLPTEFYTIRREHLYITLDYFLWHDPRMAQLSQPHPHVDLPFLLSEIIFIITTAITAIKIKATMIDERLFISNSYIMITPLKSNETD